ncbi:alanine dehydrogenase [Cylindrospermopsis raciborskii S07]|jgi:alanine dehydrogenase|uniref:Alanine dehydrogenase n=1 Tax=Cylindrospermopsis raciborskii CS-505 TaxID=533240 RepID=A0A853MI69_9CYAN|nr:MULTISPECIES: alanine dehydrogenase [Cylindrospermopsis]MBU6344372.1 alanine dehydrogenase [Cyanobacteria bacterium REEB494]EFA70660.1 Alanine dehydrogenase and pyridine nucleotide transhydrogenase [Cylindrospermopsis raciborskii CS-505]KRH96388.1 alanine dehydrogenase [Cylindrospermopsis sp. CR12]OBU77174.1 alanine dehydrogenase [Cylindrospermopsis raciborskii CS-505]PNK07010.1 alanine dehydrogenase [Cylindrospermopsis raciborskii S07]
MQIGVPKETKDQEFRVGLTPASVRVLTENNHSVFVETMAGCHAGFTDEDYLAAGGKIVASAESAWHQDLVVKVKEPLKSEYQFLRKDLLLFTYLHLAANRELTEHLIDSGTCAIAYETVEQVGANRLPLLTPMSIIAGRLAVQFGARFLESQQGGRGVLLGGVPGVKPGKVVILGGGVVGTEAAKIAVGMGAGVQILDVNVERLSYLETLFGSRVELLYSNSAQVEAVVREADLLIGAVLIPGKKAPILVPRNLVKQMRSGSVIVDVAVDQGGCVETLYPTSHSNPVYVDEGVLHYGVPNMPGAVPWTSTQALNNSTLPYVLQLANLGLEALEVNSALAKGLNIKNHHLLHPAVQEVFPDL